MGKIFENPMDSKERIFSGKFSAKTFFKRNHNQTFRGIPGNKVREFTAKLSEKLCERFLKPPLRPLPWFQRGKVFWEIYSGVLEIPVNKIGEFYSKFLGGSIRMIFGNPH